MKKVFSVCFLVLLLAGCAIYPQSNSVLGYARIADHYRIDRQRNFVVPFESVIYLPLIDRGTIENEEYPQLMGQWLHQADTSFKSRFKQVLRGRIMEGEKQSLLSARESGADYLLILLPTNWEGESWSVDDTHTIAGMKRIRFVVKLVNVRSGDLLDQIDVQAQSGYLTFWGDDPASLSAAAFNQLARDLSSR